VSVTGVHARPGGTPFSSLSRYLTQKDAARSPVLFKRQKKDNKKARETAVKPRGRSPPLATTIENPQLLNGTPSIGSGRLKAKH